MSKPKYSKEAMYLEFGQFDNVATFFFKPDTKALEKYGRYVTGTIRYSRDDREKLEENINNGQDTYGNVKLTYLLDDRDEDVKLELRKSGFACKDIERVIHLPANRENKFKKNNKREIPNVIEIPFDPGDTKYTDLFLGLFERRIARGEKLIDEEIYEFIGIVLARNEKKVPTHLLDKFDLDQEELQQNDRVWFHYFNALQEERELTQQEEDTFSRLRNKIHLKRTKIISKELNEKGNGVDPSKISQEALRILFIKIDTFKPERLLQIQFPIFWDFERFVHIYLRHVEELQIAKGFQGKSVFQYEVKDIRQLIESVLGKVKEDLKKHFENNPNKRFTRHGSMAVYFNGDYYCFDISSEGRLMTFYKQGV